MASIQFNTDGDSSRCGQRESDEKRRVQLFGLDFVSDISIDALAVLLVEQGATRQDSRKVVVTPNIDHLVNYRDWRVAFSLTGNCP
jgi:hypothetical protein